MDEYGTSWRIIWAIAVKDVMDAIRNKTVLSIVATVTFLVVLYKTVPVITSSNQPPRMAIFDAGESTLLLELERDEEIALLTATSRQEMERFLGSADDPVLGLVLPDTFDQTFATELPPEITGTFDHWVDDETVMETTAYIEQVLLDMTGKPVRIKVEQGNVYTQFNGRWPVTVSLSLIILLTMVGLLITPHLLIEESKTRTLDALLITPAKNSQVVLGKAIASFLFCLIAAGILTVVHLALIVHWEVFLLTVVSGSVFVVSLGLLVGSIFITRQALTFMLILIQPLLALPVILEAMTDVLAKPLISGLKWVPTVSLARMCRFSMIDDAPFAEYRTELLLVLGTAVIFLAIVLMIIQRADIARDLP